MSERVNKFLWNIHTAIVEKTKVPGSLEDRRFLALALCGEVGELANLVKKEWRGDVDPAYGEKVRDELGDVYAYLILNAMAHGGSVGRLRSVGPLVEARFAVLSLCASVGKLADLVEAEWEWGDDIGFRISNAIFAIRDRLVRVADAFGLDLDDVLNTITLPKIKARWGDLVKE